MRSVRYLLATIALTALVAGSAQAQSAPKKAEKSQKAEKAEKAEKEESPAALQKEAKFSLKDARALAMQTVPNATITEGGLERENGKLIYSFDMKVKGKSGVEEVQIDAITGKMISNVHETPADEAKEKKADKAKAAKKP